MSENIIKKKPGWYRYTEPHGPMLPTAPEREIKKVSQVNIAVVYGDLVLNTIVPEIPVGYTLNDVCITREFDTSPADYNEVRIVAYVNKRDSYVNEDYDKQYAVYEKNMIKYHDDLKVHKEDLRRWKLWVRQEEVKEKKTQLQHAINVLKKCGKKVTIEDA